ncbi:MAG: hypothetical protein ACON45_04495 [Paracoccaceae bacterium]
MSSHLPKKLFQTGANSIIVNALGANFPLNVGIVLREREEL